MIIIVILLILFLPILIILVLRNNKTAEFFSKCNKLCYDWGIRHLDDEDFNINNDAYTWFWNKLPSYQGMIFNLKPFKLESYFTEEEILKINN